jgi:hypothetical protein
VHPLVKRLLAEGADALVRAGESSIDSLLSDAEEVAEAVHERVQRARSRFNDGRPMKPRVRGRQ